MSTDLQYKARVIEVVEKHLVDKVHLESVQVLVFGILLPKLFWPTVRKNYSSDREKLLKFEAENLQNFWDH